MLKLPGICLTGFRVPSPTYTSSGLLTSKETNGSQLQAADFAATTLPSASVADAIDFSREDLKLPQFKDSEATTKFIRRFERLFDCLNSRNPVAQRFKAPLRPGSKGI